MHKYRRGETTCVFQTALDGPNIICCLCPDKTLILGVDRGTFCLSMLLKLTSLIIPGLAFVATPGPFCEAPGPGLIMKWLSMLLRIPAARSLMPLILLFATIGAGRLEDISTRFGGLDLLFVLKKWSSLMWFSNANKACNLSLQWGHLYPGKCGRCDSWMWFTIWERRRHL